MDVALVGVWLLASVRCKARDGRRAERDSIEVGKAKAAVARRMPERMLEKRDIATMLTAARVRWNAVAPNAAHCPFYILIPSQDSS